MKHATRSAFVAIAFFVLVGAGAAHALWAGSGVGSGAAHSVTMPTGNQPTAVLVIADIQVSWAQSVLPGGAAVDGYNVSKEDVDGLLGPIAAGGTCAGLVTALTCTDSSGDAGNWVFRITPRQFAWIGTESPPSSPAVLFAP